MEERERLLHSYQVTTIDGPKSGGITMTMCCIPSFAAKW